MFKLNSSAIVALAAITGFAVAPAAYAAQPVPVKQVAPEYPKRAKRMGISGQVTVAFDISTDGKVQTPRVVEAKPEGVFDEAAVDAVSKWKFKPLPESQTVEITIEFAP